MENSEASGVNLVSNLRDALPCIKKMENFMERKEELEKKYKDMRNQYQHCYSYGREQGVIYATLMGGFILGIIIGGILGFIFCAFFNMPSELGIFVVICSMICSAIFINKAFKKSNQSSADEYLDRQKEYGKQIEILKKETREYYTQHQKQLSIVPTDYLDSEAVQYFITVISNGRADSMKEAMNLYETTSVYNSLDDRINAVGIKQDVLARKQDVLADKLDSYSQQQNQQMNEMRNAVRSTARTAKLGVFMSAVGIVHNKK